ncbi:hypothetical protein DPEC_G00270130 [Dallia pectoralis]|uniref:Uncharacterized protein n=1 Tax=Dallia pectoralis TaxID=75939 RepID=A0ACC2FP80_DALPE|nr:hypothetical protein DPEC_G00270130 [Dallia pectoralis]
MGPDERSSSRRWEEGARHPMAHQRGDKSRRRRRARGETETVADPYIFPRLCPRAPHAQHTPLPPRKPHKAVCSSRLLQPARPPARPPNPTPFPHVSVGPEEPSYVRRRGGEKARRLDVCECCSGGVGRLHLSHHVPTAFPQSRHYVAVFTLAFSSYSV